MKLVIIDTCIVNGGEMANRGTIHDTQCAKPKDDREAYQLISAKRALKAGTPEAEEFLRLFAREQEALKQPARKAG